jgi:hypothetical protein
MVQLEDLAGRPQPVSTTATRRRQDAVAVLRQERDDLAERLAQIDGAECVNDFETADVSI